MDNLVSVIIGIYNVKRYIDRGIKQVLDQTYQNIEVLLVDDGSTDGSYEICKKWELKNNKIKVLHQENKGLGSARNLGIDHAKGNYIYFYDVDDEISSKLIEYNVGMMRQHSVDMLIFGYTSIDLTYNSKTQVAFKDKLIENNRQLRDIYVDEFVLKMNGFAWNKFYSKEFIDKHNLRFENQRIQQDEVFNMLCYRHVTRMYISSEILHTYYVYKSGNNRSRYIPDRFSIYKSIRKHFEELKCHWNIEDQRFDDYLSKRFYDGVMSCMLFNLMHSNCPLSNLEKKKIINDIMNDPYTIDAFDYAEKTNFGIEQSLYQFACKKQNLILINMLKNIFTSLRSINQKMKNQSC